MATDNPITDDHLETFRESVSEVDTDFEDWRVKLVSEMSADDDYSSLCKMVYNPPLSESGEEGSRARETIAVGTDNKRGCMIFAEGAGRKLKIADRRR